MRYHCVIRNFSSSSHYFFKPSTSCVSSKVYVWPETYPKQIQNWPNFKSGCWGRLKLGTARFQDSSVPNSPDFSNMTWTWGKPRPNNGQFNISKLETQIHQRKTLTRNFWQKLRLKKFKFSKFSVLSSLFYVSCFKWILFCKRSGWALLYSSLYELSLILWLCKRLPKILRGYHIIY